ncbi:MAG: amidohydrolase family protein [Chloroflexi bacterium]|nr:amidohydrolase family protein [Chloroflexota bacterium]
MTEKQNEFIAIQNAVLIDGTGGYPVKDSLVLIHGEKIEKTGQMGDFGLPEGTQLIDGSGKYLLPGLVDSHVHLFHEGFVPVKPKGSFLAYQAFVAANNLMTALQSGITTMRAISDGHYADLAARSAVKNKILLGPRIFAAGQGICMTGGHGTGLEGIVQVDGPQAIRKAVREQVRAGADFIKLLSSHRSDYPEFSLKEIKAGVDEAHRLGKRIAIHAGNYAGTRMAAKAGVDSIEHGNFIDPKTADLIAEKDITVVPTIWVYHFLQSQIAAMGENAMAALSAEMQEDLDELAATRIWCDRVVQQYPKTIALLLSRGIRIAAGTDNVIASEGFAVLHKEMEFMTRMGMSNMQAIVAATKHGSEVIGRGDQFGTVETGKFADLVMVDRNPLDDISVMGEVSWVMKEGYVVPPLNLWKHKPIQAPLY